MTRSDGRTLARYLAWQLPGWLLGALGISALTWGLALPGWVVLVGVALLVARDLLLYPAMRVVFQPAPPVRPLGARAVCVESLAPSGYVRVGGELWRARATDPVPAGAVVVVQAAHGLTLLVEPVRPAGAGGS
jgi:membrane protein implicated in regulation of membrane protease activity